MRTQLIIGGLLASVALFPALAQQAPAPAPGAGSADGHHDDGDQEHGADGYERAVARLEARRR